MKEAKIKMNVINTMKGFIPAHESDMELKQQLKIGKVYTIELVETRSSFRVIQFQSMLELAFQNQKKYLSKEQMLNGLMFNAGLYTMEKDSNGIDTPVRNSTGFESMDELEFKLTYEAVLLQICIEFGFDAEELKEQIKENTTNLKQK